MIEFCCFFWHLAISPNHSIIRRLSLEIKGLWNLDIPGSNLWFSLVLENQLFLNNGLSCSYLVFPIPLTFSLILEAYLHLHSSCSPVDLNILLPYFLYLEHDLIFQGQFKPHCLWKASLALCPIQTNLTTFSSGLSYRLHLTLSHHLMLFLRRCCVVKNLPAVEPQETWVSSLNWKDSLEEDLAIHSSILAWRFPWTAASGGLQFIGSQRVRHNWSNLACTHMCALRTWTPGSNCPSLNTDSVAYYVCDLRQAG